MQRDRPSIKTNQSPEPCAGEPPPLRHTLQPGTDRLLFLASRASPNPSFLWQCTQLLRSASSPPLHSSPSSHSSPLRLLGLFASRTGVSRPRSLFCCAPLLVAPSLFLLFPSSFFFRDVISYYSLQRCRSHLYSQSLFVCACCRYNYFFSFLFFDIIFSLV